MILTILVFDRIGSPLLPPSGGPELKGGSKRPQRMLSSKSIVYKFLFLFHTTLVVTWQSTLL